MPRQDQGQEGGLVNRRFRNQEGPASRLSFRRGRAVLSQARPQVVLEEPGGHHEREQKQGDTGTFQTEKECRHIPGLFIYHFIQRLQKNLI
jgi:hypothetical protein